MKRVGILSMLLALALLIFDDGALVQAQAPAAAAKTTAWKIQNAMSAAPPSKDATILDWPAKEGAEPPVLRKGTNEWTCLPDDPSSPGNDPMCLDKMWTVWLHALMGKKEPKITATGLGYMLQGGSTASNSDPFATKPAPGQKWLQDQPHVMVLVPGKLDPKVYSSDPHSGGPWIMWGGTPYEHLMVPVK